MKVLPVLILLVFQTAYGQKPRSALLKNMDKLWQLGTEQKNEGNYVQAENYFKQACLSTDSMIAILRDSSGRVRKRMHIKRGSFLFPKYPYFHSYDNLAELYTISGNFEKAEQTYRTSIARREDYFHRKSVHRTWPYVGLGKLYFATGDREKAEAQFKLAAKLLESASTSGFNYDVLANEVYRYQCEINLSKGKTQQAWKYLDRYFLALNTTSYTSEQAATAFDLKARYYLGIEDYENATLFLKKASKEVMAASQATY